MCGAIFMTSCNSGDEGAVDLDDKVEEKETLEIETVHELNENGKVEVLVFNTDVPAGTKISAKMLDTVEMDPDNLPRNVVSDAKKVRGKYSKKDFYKGDYIIENRLQDSKPLELNDETIKQEFVTELQSLLEEMFDRRIPYYATTDKRTCESCAFAPLCNL
jgi:flagella basal body P-ring formation protein FlgA